MIYIIKVSLASKFCDSICTQLRVTELSRGTDGTQCDSRVQPDTGVQRANELVKCSASNVIVINIPLILIL